MRKRNYKLFIEDILHAMGRIAEYTKDMTFKSFILEKMTFDAVIRNIEIIGEAAKNIPDTVRKKYPAVPWKRMIGLRNIAIHEYFGIDEVIIWEIVTKNLPETKSDIEKMLKGIEK